MLSKLIDMTTTANIPGMQSNAMTPLFSDTGRLLAWLLPAGALDMPWQSNPLQSSGRTVPEQCQNSGMFTDYRYTRSQQDALLPFVHYYNELKDLVDQLFPTRRKQAVANVLGERLFGERIDYVRIVRLADLLPENLAFLAQLGELRDFLHARDLSAIEVGRDGRLIKCNAP